MSNEAYLYRIFPADAARLRALARELIGAPCWAFGGAAAWDFEPARGRANLRPITRLDGEAQMDELDLSGDFGHVFSARAELRWRRSGAADYDLLVLSEAPLTIAGASELRLPGVDAQGQAGPQPWRSRAGEGLGLLQTDNFPTIEYRAYHAPNGAVQFLRYTGVRP